jgi:hypothetical protein
VDLHHRVPDLCTRYLSQETLPSRHLTTPKKKPFPLNTRSTSGIHRASQETSVRPCTPHHQSQDQAWRRYQVAHQHLQPKYWTDLSFPTPHKRPHQTPQQPWKVMANLAHHRPVYRHRPQVHLTSPARPQDKYTNP